MEGSSSLPHLNLKSMDKKVIEEWIKEYEDKKDVAHKTLERAEIMERFMRRKALGTSNGKADQALAMAQTNVENIRRNIKQDADFVRFLNELLQEK